jgi:aspartyl-tRNA(Asn)/glutamyl-tRNA(Gln) amidotransferase subunit C
MTEAELGRLEGELNHILDQYARLTELDTDAIEPTAQTIELENILRDDVVRPSFPQSIALSNAPETSDGFIVVAPILDRGD